MFGLSNSNIDAQTLKQFLRHVGHQPLKNELLAIVRRLDLDGDNEIGPNEFAEALSSLLQEPKVICDSPSKKPPLFLDRPEPASQSFNQAPTHYV